MFRSSMLKVLVVVTVLIALSLAWANRRYLQSVAYWAEHRTLAFEGVDLRVPFGWQAAIKDPRHLYLHRPAPFAPADLTYFDVIRSNALEPADKRLQLWRYGQTTISRMNSLPTTELQASFRTDGDSDLHCFQRPWKGNGLERHCMSADGKWSVVYFGREADWAALERISSQLPS